MAGAFGPRYSAGLEATATLCWTRKTEEQNLSVENDRMSESPPQNNQITVMLQQARKGDSAAGRRVFEVLVTDLVAAARNLMTSERTAHTLQPTALINEACVRLMQQDVVQSAENRRYLFAAANRAMQQVLVDHARSRSAAKRGGEVQRLPMDVLLDNFETENGVEFSKLHTAADSPRQREVVEHRYFGGFSVEETAQLMGLGTATVKRDWKLARAKLYATLTQVRE